MDLVNNNAADIIEEKDFTVDKLMDKIDELINDSKRLDEFKKNLEKMQVKDASEKIYNEIEKLVK